MNDIYNLKWFAIDFDGVLAEAQWPNREIGPAIESNIRKLMEVHNAGYKIVIHTSRPWSDYMMIERWLDDRHLPYRQIQCGKLLAKKYIDDRACHSDMESWL